MSTRILDKSDAPEKYCTFVVLYSAQIINHSAHPSLNWRTSHECFFGDTPDVSVFWGFKFWQKLRYLVNYVKLPGNKYKPGRWIGIEWQSGDHLTYEILPEDSDKSRKCILNSSVIETDDGTSLRYNYDRDN